MAIAISELDRMSDMLAFEIHLGGDRFDHQDLKEFLTGITREELDYFKKKTLENAVKYAPPEESFSKEESSQFASRSLDAWVYGIPTDEYLSLKGGGKFVEFYAEELYSFGYRKQMDTPLSWEQLPEWERKRYMNVAEEDAVYLSSKVDLGALFSKGEMPSRDALDGLSIPRFGRNDLDRKPILVDTMKIVSECVRKGIEDWSWKALREPGKKEEEGLGGRELGGEDAERLRSSCFSVLQQGYGFASPTSERITGNYARDFAGPVKWSRAIDLDPVPGLPDLKGLRYIDFKDCTNVHVLMKDGNSVLVELLPLKDLQAVSDQVSRRFGIRPSDPGKTVSSGLKF